jgi:hypothetical protein
MVAIFIVLGFFFPLSEPVYTPPEHQQKTKARSAKKKKDVWRDHILYILIVSI